MYIAIDMDKLVITHKHADHDTCSGLSFLEVADHSVRIERVDNPNFLAKFRYNDLKILYKNTVAGSQPSYHSEPDVLREGLQKLIYSWPDRDAVPEEVAAQVAAVEPELHKGTRFRYAKGAAKPAQPMELFPLTGTYTDMCRVSVPAEDKVDPYPGQHSAKAPQEPDNADQATPAEPKPQRSARTGSVRPVVRRAAEDAWEAAGKPTDKAELGALTKALIPGLEAQGYHPTTIRIKLSEWTKEKIA